MLFDDPRAREAAARGLTDAAKYGRFAGEAGHGDFDHTTPYFCDLADEVLAAAVAALDRDALVERHATSLYAYDMRSFPAARWEGEGAAMRAACRDRAQVALVAIGLIPEATKESHDQ